MKKILKGVIAAAAIVCLCSCSVTDPVGDYIKRETDQRTVGAKNIQKIDVNIDVGDCVISCGNTDNAEITCRYKAMGTDEKKVSDALEHSEMRCVERDGTLMISFIDPATGNAPDSQIVNGAGIVSLTTDLEIILPKTIDSFAVVSHVGNIELNSLMGDFDLNANLGSIRINDIDFAGDSSAKAGAGNVECSFHSVKKECTAKLSSGVGDVIFDSQGSRYEVLDSSKEFVKQNKNVLVSGMLSLEMEADVGEAKIRK